jgi:hypothetical protein
LSFLLQRRIDVFCLTLLLLLLLLLGVVQG